MISADLIAVQASCFYLCRDEDIYGIARKSFEHSACPFRESTEQPGHLLIDQY